jgi:hypothetical protein
MRNPVSFTPAFFLIAVPTGLFPSKDTLFMADLDAARTVMASEMQLGVGSAWPKTFSK